MITKVIPPAKWKTLKIGGQTIEEIFDDEFDSDLPDAKVSDLIGVYDGAELVGFVLAEKIEMVGQIYVAPAKRNNASQIARNLIRYLRDNIPDGVAVGAVASETRFEALYRSLGMQKIRGNFFRRN